MIGVRLVPSKLLKADLFFIILIKVSFLIVEIEGPNLFIISRLRIVLVRLELFSSIC